MKRINLQNWLLFHKWMFGQCTKQFGRKNDPPMPFTFALPFGQRFSIPLRAGDLWFRACCFKELLGVWGKTCESSVRKYMVTKVSQVTWIYWQRKDFTPEAFWKTPEREFREAGRLAHRQGDTILNMVTLSRSLDIPKAERSRNFSETDIISAECSFSARSYLYRIFKLKEGCTPAEWREKMAENVAAEDKKQD